MEANARLRTSSDDVGAMLSGAEGGSGCLALTNGAPASSSAGGPSLEALVGVMTNGTAAGAPAAKAKAKCTAKAKAKAGVALQSAKTPAERRDALRNMVAQSTKKIFMFTIIHILLSGISVGTPWG